MPWHIPDASKPTILNSDLRISYDDSISVEEKYRRHVEKENEKKAKDPELPDRPEKSEKKKKEEEQKKRKVEPIQAINETEKKQKINSYDEEGRAKREQEAHGRFVDELY